MNNREFVQELLDSLNKIRVKITPEEHQLTPRFKLVETLHNKTGIEVPHKESNVETWINIQIVLEHVENYIVLGKRYMLQDTASEVLDTVYGLVKEELIKNILFLKECAYKNERGEAIVCIPISTIIKEGYDNAKVRILNEHTNS